ncbi:DEAD/DEAH box helicase family protein [Plantactinospora sp. KLBMP9567]|uniref:DEAD/DEAH box helicase family protein n=1 Tax=Plantactinospora sp. KLBMP9567 TaxID=3085900 RepID=UPI002982717A|nr:DEAD/DEAH box helicase family protein [Plantactinospora sp. KLBMP9567]MDW5325357.1 DEAD/DEAH box helicase family protein [Plantactinospora sp. KLBMP9567]
MNDLVGVGLRPHQVAAVNAIEQAVAAGRKTMRVVMATGSGKSAVMGHALAALLASGHARQPLYLTPHRAIAEQMVARLRSLDLGEEGLLGDTHQVHLLRPGSEAEIRGGTVTVATSSQFRRMHRTRRLPEFDVVVLDELDSDLDWPTTTVAAAIGRDATVIAFSSHLPRGDSIGQPVFTYDIGAALADGVLVDTFRQGRTDQSGRWPSFNPRDPSHSQRRVFLGGAEQDRNTVQMLAVDLRRAGIRVAEASEGIPSDAAPGDVFVSVLSPSSLQTPLVDDEVGRSLERRGVDVVPVVTEYSAVPAQLAARLPVDITNGTEGLLRRLQAGAMLDLETLDPMRFERLVSVLLDRLGFRSSPSIAASVGDSGVDIIATFQDPDGFGIATQYLIQARVGRSSFRDVDKLVQLVADAGQPWRGMVVTNGQLTSVSGRRLARARVGGVVVDVVDGPRLRSLLLRHPDLIVDHFVGR